MSVWTAMYWTFLDEHEDELRSNRRMNLMLGSMRQRAEETKAADRAVTRRVRRRLAAGETLEVEDG